MGGVHWNTSSENLTSHLYFLISWPFQMGSHWWHRSAKISLISLAVSTGEGLSESTSSENLNSQCSIFKCSMWWSVVHCTIGYPNMQVSTVHHGPWPFFTVDPHPRVHVHRPTVVCSSHNCVGLQEIPLTHPSSLPTNRFTYSPFQSACTQTNSCLWMTQPCWATGNPP